MIRENAEETPEPAATSCGPEIFRLVPMVRAEIGAIVKAKKNESQGYRFRGIDDILNAVGPALTKCGITLSTTIVSATEDLVATEDPRLAKLDEWLRLKAKFRWVIFAKIHLRVTLYAPDGSNVSFEAFGSACDHNGDKAANKAHSVAYKYAMTLGLCIPVEEGDMDDSDHDDRVPERKPSDRRPAGAAGAGRRNATQAMSNPARPQSADQAKSNKQMLLKRAEAAIARAADLAKLAQLGNEFAKSTYGFSEPELEQLGEMISVRSVELNAGK